MAKRSKNEVLKTRHFRWVLRRRGGVYFADGRVNHPSVGRHSLGTRDHDEALRRLNNLDQVQAVEAGLASPSQAVDPSTTGPELRDGWELYRSHLARPEVAGGTSRKTQQRYAAILDKFIPFAQGRGVRAWSDVDAHLIESYLGYLQKRRYADRTMYAEGTVLKQLVRWLVAERRIPGTCLIRLPLRKVHGTRTHCWTRAEVTAMIDFCRGNPDLDWLADVIVALATTGVRISELAALRWRDIDFERNLVHVSNDPIGTPPAAGPRRRTKNRQDRTVPIHTELRTVLDTLDRHPDGRVFHGPLGGVIKPDTIRNVLVRDVIEPLKARFPATAGERGFEHGRLHSFRHYFCSAAVNGGTPQASLMDWLGHQDSAMVRHYYHLHNEESQQHMTRLSFTGKGDHDVVVGPLPESMETPPGGRPAREAS